MKEKEVRSCVGGGVALFFFFFFSFFVFQESGRYGNRAQGRQGTRKLECQWGTTQITERENE